MKTRILALFLALCCSLSFAACDTPSVDESTGTGTETTEKDIPNNDDPIILVQDNQTEYSIVRAADATEAEIKAADELRSYIFEITGCNLGIITDDQPETDAEIVVGYTNRQKDGQFDESALGNEGFAIERVGKKLFIAGSDTHGALYGVYTFLEEYLGVRFYASTYEYIPKNPTLILQPFERNTQVPVFEFRDIDFVTSRVDDYQTKLKLNGAYAPNEASSGGKVDYVGFVHTFDSLVPPSLYKEEHPEYWGMNADGTPQTQVWRQLCLSNPDVLRIATDSVRAWLEANPTADIISISQMDSTGSDLPCMCQNCQAIYDEEGAYSGAIIRFVNAIAAEFAEEYPNTQFDTLAYRYSRSVCKTAPADNVIVRLCTIECCFSHPLGSCPDFNSSADSNTIAEDIVAWSEITDNIYVWDYVTCFTESVTIFPNFNTLLPNAKFFADHNVKGVYEEGNYFSETSDFAELRSYIMAKILWDPYMTEEEYWGHIDDFLHGMYGEGWQNIRAYIDLAQDLVKDMHFGIGDRAAMVLYPYERIENDKNVLPDTLTLDMIKNYETTDWSPYLGCYYDTKPSELVTRGYELFDAALAQADEEQAERIDVIKMQLDFLNSYALQNKYRRNALKDNIRMLLQNFFKQHPDGMTVPQDEQTSYKSKICDYVIEKYLGIYEEFNRDLYRRAIRYGITRIYEGSKDIREAGEDKIGFKNVPYLW